MKWAAGCSLVHSPNDVSKCHLMARMVLKQSTGLPLAQCSPGLKACKARLEATNIPMDRKRSFWQLLSNLPTAASEAFRPRIVRDGWNMCGYYPFCPLLLLSRCTLWLRNVEDGGLTAAEKMSVLNGIPALRAIAKQHGRVSDAEMEAAFPFLRRYPTELASDLGHLATNRDRCALLVHPVYFASRAISAAAAIAANPNLRKPKKSAVIQSRPRQKWEAYDDRSKRCASWEIEAQLAMRGVPKGYAIKKESLLSLWHKNSALPDIRQAVRPAPDASAPALGFEIRLQDSPSRTAAISGGVTGRANAQDLPVRQVLPRPNSPVRGNAQPAARASQTPAPIRHCSVCGQTGHRADSSKCPKAAGVGAVAAPGSAPAPAPLIKRTANVFSAQGLTLMPFWCRPYAHMLLALQVACHRLSHLLALLLLLCHLLLLYGTPLPCFRCSTVSGFEL